jgi:hypothetical protein
LAGARVLCAVSAAPSRPAVVSASAHTITHLKLKPNRFGAGVSRLSLGAVSLPGTQRDAPPVEWPRANVLFSKASVWRP